MNELQLYLVTHRSGAVMLVAAPGEMPARLAVAASGWALRDCQVTYRCPYRRGWARADIVVNNLGIGCADPYHRY